jgi:3-hydroxybutyryl-CoA dehydratase
VSDEPREEGPTCIELSRTVVEGDLEAFAQLSLDRNPVHFDPEFAKTTFFGQPVAHGMIGLSLLSGGLTDLMGPGNLWLGGEFKFEKPILVGDRLMATLKIESMDRRGVAMIEATVENDRGETVITARLKSMKARPSRG